MPPKRGGRPSRPSAAHPSTAHRPQREVKGSVVARLLALGGGAVEQHGPGAAAAAQQRGGRKERDVALLATFVELCARGCGGSVGGASVKGGRAFKVEAAGDARAGRGGAAAASEHRHVLRRLRPPRQQQQRGAPIWPYPSYWPVAFWRPGERGWMGGWVSARYAAGRQRSNGTHTPSPPCPAWHAASAVAAPRPVRRLSR